MRPEPTVLCPLCGGEQALDRCASCGRLRDLRGDLEVALIGRECEPDPVPLQALQRAEEGMANGTSFKAVLEQLLREILEDQAEQLMLWVREGRGAWMPLVRARSGAALLVGNAFSGTAIPLARAGWRVTVLDRSIARASFGQARNRALVGDRTRALVGGDGERLPFVERAFDLVVLEQGLPGRPGPVLDEFRRVCAGELVLVGDNRLGYKRSRGRRGEYHVPSAIEFARAVLWPRGARTLPGYRALLERDGFERPRAFALYPAAREFSHVVALEQDWPRLSIGPKERRNRMKTIAQGAGLFSLFTPSFALCSSRSELDRGGRIEGVLDALADRLGEPRPRVEHWIATRGNSAVLLTGRPEDSNDDPSGRWCLHLPLSPQQQAQIARHHAVIGSLRRDFADVPVPEPLFLGELDGLYLAVERRLGGWTAPQSTGDRAVAAVMFLDAARCLSRLVVRPAQALDREEFEELFGRKLDLVARFAHVRTTVERLGELRRALEGELLGLCLPRVLYHADLRSKHVQIAPDGRILGLLDWGSSTDSDLPLFDLLHLIVHERKQEADLSAAAAWQSIRDPAGWRSHERAALEGYVASLVLPPTFVRAVLELYPVLVGAMAEANWDYSRPRWVSRQFGI